MATGDVKPVPDCTDLYYLDTGMYATEEYTSVYLLDAKRPAVVDTGIGTDRELVSDALDEVGIGRDDLEFILPTHVHLDHAGGAGFLAERYPNATVLTHEIGVPHLIDPTRLVEGTKKAVGDMWEFYTEPKPVPEDRIEPLTQGSEIDLGDRTLVAHHAPGHAPHQVIFHDSGDDVVFTADAAGLWAPSVRKVGPTSPPSNFHLEKAMADAETIKQIDPRYLCYGHFGPRAFEPSQMDEYKRVLVEWVEAIRQKRRELGDDEAVVQYFVERTEMAEVWTERKAREEERMNVRGVLGYLHYVGEP